MGEANYARIFRELLHAFDMCVKEFTADGRSGREEDEVQSGWRMNE